ncbi:rCG38134, partial [Rattus norvegicus]
MNQTCYLNNAAKYDDIKKLVKLALRGLLRTALCYTEDQVFSNDLNDDTHFSTFDVMAGIVFNDNNLISCPPKNKMP